MSADAGEELGTVVEVTERDRREAAEAVDRERREVSEGQSRPSEVQGPKTGGLPSLFGTRRVDTGQGGYSATGSVPERSGE